MIPNNKVDIYYIDLKSDKPSGYQGQFKSTRCFIYYVQRLLKELLNIDMEIRKERFIIFHTDSSGAIQSMSNQPSRHTPRDANSVDKPDKRIVFNGDTIRCTDIF